MSDSLAALNRRIDDIAVAAKGSVQHSDLDALAGRIAALEDNVKALSDNVAHRPASADDRAARAAVAAEALRAVVERGAPYQAELAAVKSFGADQNAMTALEPFAADGLPSAAELAHELSQLTPALLQASGAAAKDGSFIQRLERSAKSLVRVTPIDAPPSNEPSAIIARLNADAERADIADAVAANRSPAAIGANLGRTLGAEGECAQRRHRGEPAHRRRRARRTEQRQHTMIRVVSFLIVIGALSLAVAWIADRPGDVVITWQGLRIETSLMVLGAAILVLVALLLSLWSLHPRRLAFAGALRQSAPQSPRRARL